MVLNCSLLEISFFLQFSETESGESGIGFAEKDTLLRIFFVLNEIFVRVKSISQISQFVWKKVEESFRKKD